MIVLVINCGSSSLKFRLYRMPEEKVMATGSGQKDGAGNTQIKIVLGKNQYEQQWEGFDYEEMLNQILQVLQDSEKGCLASLDEIDVAGHRLIHGSDKNEDAVEIDDDLIACMENYVGLAPLHYPPNLAGVKATRNLIPVALQTGVFDTAFHQSLPQEAYLYGLPYEWFEKHGIRKYGFHGISHRYALLKGCQVAGRIVERSKVIVCHLGNGASITAIKNGKSMDTSMGMTPVEGLLMGTRSGDIDPGVLVYLQQNFDLDAEALNHLLNKESGLMGLSGVSSDYRKVEEAAEQGDMQAKLALGVYHYRIKKYIGAYLAVLGGANLLVFTGGIGENSSSAREIVTRNMEWAGISVRPELNRQASGKEAVISALNSPVQVVVVPANEELMIAREAFQLAKTKKKS